MARKGESTKNPSTESFAAPPEVEYTASAEDHAWPGLPIPSGRPAAVQSAHQKRIGIALKMSCGARWRLLPHSAYCGARTRTPPEGEYAKVAAGWEDGVSAVGARPPRHHWMDRKITFMARLGASSCSAPRFDLKIHLSIRGKPTCGQTVAGNSTSAIEDVSCKKCLAMIKVIRNPVPTRLFAPFVQP
jgi:hypothetical protein